MERFFNTAGPLNPAKHYVLDPLQRWDLPKVLSLINQEKYFLLHAPRQTGKTTCLHALASYLNKQGDLHCVCISTEGGQAAREDVGEGIHCLLMELATKARVMLHDTFVEEHAQEYLRKYRPLKALQQILVDWCENSSKPVVILMDEIDALVGDTLIAVLRQLRSGYCDRRWLAFPQSIVLCGMRHLRDYRMQLGPKAQEVFTEGSPFNINSESLRL
ncbi:MAG: AAA family ATPase, partial [Myxococcota bacterium]